MSSLLLILKKIFSLKLHLIKIENVRTPFGEPFNQDNHWVKTLQEYDEGMRDYSKSSLYNFHKKFKPVNIFNVMPSNERDPRAFFLGEYPWGRWAKKSTKEEWFEGTHCGPSSDETIKKEWINFVGLYKKILSEGLLIKKYGYPLGSFLIDEDRVKYFIVLGGNHRMAIISHLELAKKVPVRAIARDNISQFSYYARLKIKYPRPGIDINSTRKLFKCLISNEFNINEN